jgi:hypothetical protein
MLKPTEPAIETPSLQPSVEGRPFNEIRDLALLTSTVQATVDLLREPNPEGVIAALPETHQSKQLLKSLYPDPDRDMPVTLTPDRIVDELNHTHPSLWAERRDLSIIRGEVVLTNLSGTSLRPPGPKLPAEDSLCALRVLDEKTRQAVATGVDVARVAGRYSDWLSLATSWNAAQLRGDSAAALSCAYAYTQMELRKQHIDLTMERSEHLNDTFRGEAIRSYLNRQMAPGLVHHQDDPHNSGPLFPKLTERETSLVIDYVTSLDRQERHDTALAAEYIGSRMGDWNISSDPTILPSQVLEEWRDFLVEVPDPGDWDQLFNQIDRRIEPVDTGYAALYLHSLIAPTALTPSTVRDQVAIPLDPNPLHTIDPSLAHLVNETDPERFIEAFSTLTPAQLNHVDGSAYILMDQMDLLPASRQEVYDLWHSAIAREANQRANNAEHVNSGRGTLVAVDEVDHFAWASLMKTVGDRA